MTHQELRELLVDQIKTLDKISDRLVEQTCRLDELTLRIERLLREAPEVLARYGLNLDRRRTREYLEDRLSARDRVEEAKIKRKQSRNEGKKKW